MAGYQHYYSRLISNYLTFLYFISTKAYVLGNYYKFIQQYSNLRVQIPVYFTTFVVFTRVGNILRLQVAK